ncbi:hypothetical protein F7725_017152 [Dissostichus mawsoni]|uniref:Uncharacterized protein n=1 Tax=Dissostichus mawsoni TaxID=36200 RepID=A0A7J5Z5S7_DISMA|nr:hypothetical protein F7725_017152 [Dissostichus mawsoni]
MFLKRNTCFMVFLLCSLTLWCKSTSAGSSYLSPSQKPQNKGRSSRVGRQVMETPGPPAEENHITISAPFEIGFTVREQDFEEYGTALQEVIQRLLGNTEPAAEYLSWEEIRCVCLQHDAVQRDLADSISGLGSLVVVFVGVVQADLTKRHNFWMPHGHQHTAFMDT